MTIVTKEVDGHGPYVYRAEYKGENFTEWTYIGPVGEVDPESITKDELNELGQSVIDQYRDGTRADLARQDVANDLRDQLIRDYGEEVLAPTDDRRLTVVELAEDAPRDAEIIVCNTAEDMQAATRTVGQAELTKDEKESLDFTERPIFHARASKAVLKDAGIDDWQSLYDPQIEDPATHREIAEDNRESIQGDRLDNEEQQIDTISQEQAANQQEKQALQYAKDGDEDAQEYLKSRGWTDAEIQEYPA